MDSEHSEDVVEELGGRVPDDLDLSSDDPSSESSLSASDAASSDGRKHRKKKPRVERTSEASITVNDPKSGLQIVSSTTSSSISRDRAPKYVPVDDTSRKRKRKNSAHSMAKSRKNSQRQFTQILSPQKF